LAIADFIQLRGFKKWYERELARSHVQLLLLLCSTLAVFGAMEGLFEAQGSARWWLAISLLTALAIGAWALRRYLFLLMRAESVARQAVCEKCGAYGRWDVRSREASQANEVRMNVCCRACGHLWQVEL
jgi:uncharacterized membrane protein YcfT